MRVGDKVYAQQRWARYALLGTIVSRKRRSGVVFPKYDYIVRIDEVVKTDETRGVHRGDEDLLHKLVKVDEYEVFLVQKNGAD